MGAAFRMLKKESGIYKTGCSSNQKPEIMLQLFFFSVLSSKLFGKIRHKSSIVLLSTQTRNYW